MAKNRISQSNFKLIGAIITQLNITHPFNPEGSSVLNLRLLDDHYRAMSMMSAVIAYTSEDGPATKSLHDQFLI